MKAKFLAAAGVKTEKEFYNLYPDTPEGERKFWAKCGAKIKKAYPGIKIPKAEDGFEYLQGDYNLDGAANAGDNIDKFGNATGANNPMGGLGGMLKGLTGGNGMGGALSSLTGGNPLGMVTDIFKGVKAQKEEVKKADQSQKTTRYQANALASNKLYEQQNLQDARLKTYVGGDRDTRNGIPGMTGEELFPMYGVGTNPIAKDGATIKAVGGLSSILGSGEVWKGMGQQGLNAGAPMLGQALGIGGDMGSQIGGKLGSTIGSLTGIPGMDKVGELVLGGVGDLLDRSDSKIAKSKALEQADIDNMTGIKAGSYFQNQNRAYAKNGIKAYGLGGDVKVQGNGGLEQISYNPYAGPMEMIKGPSHSEGGVDMTIFPDDSVKMEQGGKVDNGVDLEAEGREVMMKTGGENGEPEAAVILGNEFVPLHTKKALESFTGVKLSGSKFKNVGTAIAKEEESVGKKKEKNIMKATDLSALVATDRPGLSALKVMEQVYDDEMKKLKIGRDVLSSSQEAINIANSKGDNYLRNKLDKNPFKMKGSTAWAEDGLKLYAKDGVTTTDTTTLPPNTFRTKEDAFKAGFYETKDGKLERILEEGKDPINFEIPGQSTTKLVDDPNQPGYNVKGGKSDVSVESILGDAKKYKTFHERTANYTDEEKKAAAEALYKKGVMPGFKAKQTVITEDGQPTQIDIPGEPTTYEYANLFNEKEKEADPKKEGKGFDWLGGLGQLWRDTDAEAFDNNQLRPELWAMANNKLEPVQSQKFEPRLRVPYDISLQDQLNENTASARSAERMAAYNPGQLASLKAQEYMADSKVLGDQFRQNQGFKDQIYSGNLATINDAQLKNLAIADTQYVRQEQAKSNTKATDFEAMKSMTDKQLKHALENKTLRVMENMYDYRYDKSGRAHYMGEGFNSKDMWESGVAAAQIPEGMEISGYDKQGRPRFSYKSSTSTKTNDFNVEALNGSIVKKFKKFK